VPPEQKLTLDLQNEEVGGHEAELPEVGHLLQLLDLSSQPGGHGTHRFGGQKQFSHSADPVTRSSFFAKKKQQKQFAPPKFRQKARYSRSPAATIFSRLFFATTCRAIRRKGLASQRPSSLDLPRRPSAKEPFGS
jgi:hypothetical protein